MPDGPARQARVTSLPSVTALVDADLGVVGSGELSLLRHNAGYAETFFPRMTPAAAKQLRAMADRRNRFVFTCEVLHAGDDLGIHAADIPARGHPGITSASYWPGSISANVAFRVKRCPGFSEYVCAPSKSWMAVMM